MLSRRRTEGRLLTTDCLAHHAHHTPDGSSLLCCQSFFCYCYCALADLHAIFAPVVHSFTHSFLSFFLIASSTVRSFILFSCLHSFLIVCLVSSSSGVTLHSAIFLSIVCNRNCPCRSYRVSALLFLLLGCRFSSCASRELSRSGTNTVLSR